MNEGLNYDDTIADVFIVDYALSDSPPCCGYKTFAEIANHTENMVRLLLALPAKPAVVYIETFTANELYSQDCKHSSDEYPHAPVLRKYKVPTIDYNTAVCQNKSSDSFWDDTHPSAVPTH